MAYAKKYEIEFSDVYSNSVGQYQAFIYKKDYVGAIYELTSDSVPLTIETDRQGNSSYKPVIGSVANLNLLLQTIGDFNIAEFLLADIDTFYLEIIKDNVLRWKGYYLPTSDVTIDEIAPISVSLSFSDLLLIKSTLIYESDTVRDIGFNAIDKISIKDLLLDSVYASKLDFEVRINFPYSKTVPNVIINSDGSTSSKTITMDEMYIFKNSLLNAPADYFDYFTILSGICSQFGLMAYQKQGIFYITSYDQLINESSRVFKRYASSGKTYLGDITESDSAIALNSSTFRQIGQSQKVIYSLPYKYLDVSTNTSKASNSYNSFLWGFDLATGTLRASGISNVGSNSVPNSKTTYPTLDVSPFNRRFGLRFISRSTGSYPITLDYTQYWETQPINVSQGDIISANALYGNDAVIVSTDPTFEAFSQVFVTLKYNDPDGNTKYLYTVDTGVGGIIFTDTIPTLSGSPPTANFKNLIIPQNGELTIRILQPYSFQLGGSIYIEYLTLQVYKGEQIDSVPSTITSRSYFANKINNKEIFENKSVLSFYYGARYDDFDGSNNDASNAAVVTNAIITEWYQYINDDASNGIQGTIGQAIQKNIGTLNATIQGNFKSSFYDIGQKFTYQITGFDSKSFCLLDYKMNLKYAEQDSIIYSCEFNDITGFVFVNKKLENF
jgi:hypothetical protein